MGACFSKKRGSSSSPSVAAVSSAAMAPPKTSHNDDATGCENSTTHKVKAESGEPKMKMKKTAQATQEDQKVEEDEGGPVKKEIFVIKHRKSHDVRDRGRDSRSPPPQQDAPLVPHGLTPTAAATTTSNESADESIGNKVTQAAAAGVGVRTSSCTKEEVDAILIQCGRLSRSSSGKATTSSASYDRSRKYSGSKRSYDFDEAVAADDDQKKANVIENNDLCEEDERRQHRQRHRQSPRPSSSSQGRRRTPSRERDQQQRSSSRERRVSRSPGRRSSETTTPASTTTGSAPATANTAKNGNRPGKMVSVPATVSSLVMDKSNNGGGGESATATAVKRISVRRNVGSEAVTAGSRGASSPRSQSPARANAHTKISNDNQQQQQPPSLSRSSSRKAEHSPCRRNPLSEIDPNSLAYPQPLNNSSGNSKKPNPEIVNSMSNRAVVQGTNYKTSSRGPLDNQVVTVNCIPKEQRQLTVEEALEQSSMTGHVDAESLNPQKLTRSRSSRRSRDLDLNPETLLNPNPSYTTLLLEDIQNFHQKNTNTASVSLPACVTKACSILEAVADLNSTTSSNLSCAFSDDRKSPPTYQSSRTAYNISLGNPLVGKMVAEAKDPFIESEIAVSDDVMEPSFHKYVTVRRGCGLGGEDMEDQESSGSNSFVSQQHWGFSSSSWEPNSADSTDCWTSRLNTREEDQKRPQGSVLSEPVSNMDEASKRLSGKKRDCEPQQSRGIGRGRVGVTRGLHTIPVVAATAAST
ncbi:hypothetical protein F2P56_000161 [Juglans regia]|uniref:Uncharacterized protein At1g65710-like isoform X2 n=2 Tax=Juglans regia TaxID=51240 RepID=A0A2I4FR80_JUGRE|nr:uncharacterized protein At1g65710-like isoform X2 [Juglans regia]KAF5479328.1 hypothetical protein F2P56_000161 [Juglans regia]